MVIEDAIYVWGGFSYSSPYAYADGWKLSRQDGSWRWDRLPDLPWRISSSGLAAIGSKIYLFGGADYDLKAFHTAHDRSGGNLDLGSHLIVLDVDDLPGGWRRLPDCPGTPRWVHTLSAVGGRLYVIGGATGGPPYCSVVDNWTFDPATDRWTRVRDLPISSGNFPNGSNIVFDDRYIVLVGGYQYGCAFEHRVSIDPYGSAHRAPGQPALYYADVFVYDTQMDLFGRADPLPLNNNLPMATARGDEIFLIGGETGGARLKDAPAGAVYDPEGEYFGHHPDLCLIGRIELIAPPRIEPDFDADGDVDLDDFGHLQACFTGVTLRAIPTGCDDADFDRDRHVDEDDFRVMLGCLSGANVAPEPACDD